MGLGFLMVWKTLALQGWVGVIDWAEQKLGPGGTNTFLKLLGVGVIFLGIAIAVNLINEILGSIAGIFIIGN